MSCDKYQVGDKGQRYEVRATRISTGAVEVIGWTNMWNGPLLKAWKQNPAYEKAHAVDRRASDYVALEEA